MIRAFSFFTLFLMVQTLSAQELVDGFCRDGQGYFEFTDGEYFGECKNRTTMHGEGEYIFYSCLEITNEPHNSFLRRTG